MDKLAEQKHVIKNNKDIFEGKLRPHTIITSHSNPDFDALGAMVAASKLYPDAALIMPTGNNQTVQKFLREEFFKDGGKTLFGFIAAKDVDFSEVRHLILVDTKQGDRVPQIASLIQELKNADYRKKVCIEIWDHHPDNEDDLKADKLHMQTWGSTVAILVHAMREQSVQVSPPEATMMGLGIYGDTGSFTFSATTSYDMDAASWLLSQGMNLGIVADLVRHDFSAEQVRVLNMLLESATSHFIHGVHIVITRISLDTYLPDFASLVSTMMDMSSNTDGSDDGKETQDITAIFALARMDDKVQVVARSRSKAVDVQAICQELGGGGHTFAASASVKDKTLDEVHDTIFRQIRLGMDDDVFITKLMSTPAITIEQHRSIKHAEEVMNRFGLKAIPVVHTNSKVCLGYLEYQTATRAIAHQLGHLPTSAYMQRNFSSITKQATLQDVMDIIIDQRQRIVPVVQADTDSEKQASSLAKQSDQNGDIIGVVTRTDLINAIVDASARKPEMLLPQKRKSRNIRHMMQDNLPQHVLKILEQAGRLGDRLGLDVYIVGGFVRDVLLGQPNLDIDIVVEGDGIAFAKIFAQELQGRVREHEAFKTALIIYDDTKKTEGATDQTYQHNEQRIDVATARLEYYEYPAALPSVALSSIKMDLFRRDFTINAMALQLNGAHFGKLIDFFNAQNDIKKGVVRVLHSLSFVEDPTRIMRAIRFEQRYDFSLGQQTMRLIKNALELQLVQKLSGARIFHEFSIMSNENNALGCFKRLDEFGILKNIHEKLELTPQKNIILERMDNVLTWYDLLYLEAKPERWLTWLLCLSHGANYHECIDITRRFNLNPSQTKRFFTIREYVARHTLFSHKDHQSTPESMKPSALYRLLSPLELEGILYAMAVANSESLRKQTSYYLNMLQHTKTDINGHDLRNMGLEASPHYARILQQILDAKLDGEAPNRTLQLAMARSIIEQIEKNTKTG